MNASKIGLFLLLGTAASINLGNCLPDIHDGNMISIPAEAGKKQKQCEKTDQINLNEAVYQFVAKKQIYEINEFADRLYYSILLIDLIITKTAVSENIFDAIAEAQQISVFDNVDKAQEILNSKALLAAREIKKDYKDASDYVILRSVYVDALRVLAEACKSYQIAFKQMKMFNQSPDGTLGRTYGWVIDHLDKIGAFIDTSADAEKRAHEYLLDLDESRLSYTWGLPPVEFDLRRIVKMINGNDLPTKS